MSLIFLESAETPLFEQVNSQSPDLPLPHGLAPSKTMVWDMVSIRLWAQKTLEIKGFSGSGAPIFGFGLADPAP